MLLLLVGIYETAAAIGVGASDEPVRQAASVVAPLVNPSG